MEFIKNKYENIFEDIYENTNFKTDSNKHLNNSICNEEMPNSSNIRISTTTMICSFNSNINLGVVGKFFKTDNIITFMDNGGKPVKNSDIKKNNRPFFNQATLIVKLNPLKKINVKIFSNGKIQMTGVKTKIDGYEALKYIINKLYKLEGDIPLSKLFIKQQVELLNDKLQVEELPFKYYKKNKTNSKHVYSSTVLYEKDNVIIDKFVKSLNIELIIKDLISHYDGEDILVKTHSIEDIEKVQIGDIQIVNIVSDFNTNFEIKRDVLYNIIKNNYQIVSRFDPCIYPGVKNKFFYNEKYLDKEFPGKCYCKGKCLGKGNGNGEGDCKQITISIFQSGSILITWAKNIDHIEYIRKFVIDILKKNFNLVKRIKTPFEEIDNGEQTETKKYIRSCDIISIKIDDLNNEYNTEIMDKYNQYLKNIKSNI